MGQVSVEHLSNVKEIVDCLNFCTYKHLPCIASQTKELALHNEYDEPFFKMNVPDGFVDDGDLFYVLGWIEDVKSHYHVVGLSKDGLIGIDINVCDFTQVKDSPSNLEAFMSLKSSTKKLYI